MAWNYIFPSAEAIHKETGIRFIVTYRNEIVEQIDDFEISPEPSRKTPFDLPRLRSLKDELFTSMTAQQQERRRWELESLVEKNFMGENNRAATVLSQITGRNVSERTIQAWLIDPRRRSSRNCPHWAIKALKNYLENPENQARLDETRNARREFPRTLSPLAEVYDKHSVRRADADIEADGRRLGEWTGAKLSSLPEMICETERKHENNLSYLNKINGIILNAMRTCKNFDDFKEKVLGEQDELERIDNVVRRTRNAIEEKREEFSNSDGLLE